MSIIPAIKTFFWGNYRPTSICFLTHSKKICKITTILRGEKLYLDPNSIIDIYRIFYDAYHVKYLDIDIFIYPKKQPIFCHDSKPFESIFGRDKLYSTCLQMIFNDRYTLSTFNCGLLKSTEIKTRALSSMSTGVYHTIDIHDHYTFATMIGSLFNPYTDISLYLKRYSYIYNIWLKLYIIAMGLCFERIDVVKILLSNFTLGLTYTTNELKGEVSSNNKCYMRNCTMYYHGSSGSDYQPLNSGYGYKIHNTCQNRYYASYLPQMSLISNILIILGFTVDVRKRYVFSHPTEVFLQWDEKYTSIFVDFYAHCIYSIIKNDKHTYGEDMHKVIFSQNNPIKTTYDILTANNGSDDIILSHAIIFFETMRVELIGLRGGDRGLMEPCYQGTACHETHEIINSIKYPSLLLLKSHPLHHRLIFIFNATLNLLNEKFREFIINRED